jgi:hypothetical protein
MLRATLVLLAFTAVARADDDVAISPPGLTPTVAPAQPPKDAPLPDDYTPSYRGQVLGADGAAVGLVFLAAMNGMADGRSTNTTSLLELGATTYLIGAPLIHLVHDRGKAALGSLGLRIALPVIGGLIAGRVSGSCSDYCSDNDTAIFLGVLTGLVSATVIDAVFLADADPKPSATHLAVTPLRGGGTAFGLAGSF